MDQDSIVPVVLDSKSGTRKAIRAHKKEFHTLNSWMFYTGPKGFFWALKVFY
jgi:hypothetical protein